METIYEMRFDHAVYGESLEDLGGFRNGICEEQELQRVGGNYAPRICGVYTSKDAALEALALHRSSVYGGMKHGQGRCSVEEYYIAKVIVNDAGDLVEELDFYYAELEADCFVQIMLPYSYNRCVWALDPGTHTIEEAVAFLLKDLQDTFELYRSQHFGGSPADFSEARCVEQECREYVESWAEYQA